MRLFNSPTSRYDIIIRRDVLKYGFVLDHARQTLSWDGLTIDMIKSVPHTPVSNTCLSCAIIAAGIYTTAATKILHAKYDKASPSEVAKAYNHLNLQQQHQSLDLLVK